jgi:hypothetical protein
LMPESLRPDAPSWRARVAGLSWLDKPPDGAEILL